MIKNSATITSAKEKINRLKEKSVEVTLNLGRNKFVTFRAKLDGVYPALFTVKPDDKSFKGKTSYSYSEYLCGRVRLNPLSSEEVENG